MLKKTGFCGLMVSIVLGICLRWRLNNSGILPDMLSIAGFVFALMYIWDEMKKESRKALLWKGTGVIIGTALLAFVIIKGRESIISLPFFSGWETPAQAVYILSVLVLAAILISYINEIFSKS
ncbi:MULTISPECIES: YoqO family protein [Bacillus]|uniref:YoqO family protein n=1 Tax=Bacillus TaxID=1386 RepID=UPI0022E74B3B|nr:YoqO family protein [Bacillus sonorensis]